MMKRGMSWLGLGPEENYDQFDDGYDEPDEEYFDDEPLADEPEPARRPRAVAPTPTRAPARPSRVSAFDDPAEAGVTVLPVSGAMVARPLGSTDSSLGRGVVRPLPSPSNARPRVISPSEFNDAQKVGDWFKKGRAVVVNLQGLERDLARRLLDFTSGVAYGLGGRVEKIASHVYLLSPTDVEISSEDRRRLSAGDLSDDED